MKKCNLSTQVNIINKQFNILNPSTRTRERFEQSWTALRRFKTDVCGAAIQYLGAEGATFVKFLLLIWLQPSSFSASARHRLSVQASATEQIAEIERGEERMVTRSPGPSPAYYGEIFFRSDTFEKMSKRNFSKISVFEDENFGVK